MAAVRKSHAQGLPPLESRANYFASLGDDTKAALIALILEHPDHTDLGFVRKMWILGRLRHLKIIDYYSECGNAMTSLEDLERFKQNRDQHWVKRRSTVQQMLDLHTAMPALVGREGIFLYTMFVS